MPTLNPCCRYGIIGVTGGKHTALPKATLIARRMVINRLVGAPHTTTARSWAFFLQDPAQVGDLGVGGLQNIDLHQPRRSRHQHPETPLTSAPLATRSCNCGTSPVARRFTVSRSLVTR